MRKLIITNNTGIATMMNVVIDGNVVGSIAGRFLITSFGKQSVFSLDEKEHSVQCFYKYTDSDDVSMTNAITIPCGKMDYSYYVIKKRPKDIFSVYTIELVESK